jgi:two-component system response regulator FlrC
MEIISTLLVVSDPTMRNHLTGVLQTNDKLRIESCSSAKKALDILKDRSFQIVYADLDLDEMPGVALVKKIKQIIPATHVIVGSATGTAQDVILAMQAGAAEFLVDPYSTELVENAFEKAVVDVLKQQPPSSIQGAGPKEIITQDKALFSVLDIAKKVAPSTASILITGESGTGKEVLASFIHHNSNRNNEPYVAVNCAALPEQLAESELFGHEKGAFTGAISRKIGKFESAGKGSLVLDEITEMALPLQAKLLRALQEREIVRLGSNRPIPTFARVIAISNRSIKKAVQEGIFREDLFYRLNVIPLTIPPLRERKSDIPLLADYFLKRFSAQNGKSMSSIADESMELLIKQTWPGNVRELENTIQRGVLIGSGDVLLAEHLILEESLSEQSRKPPLSAGMTVREMEKALIYNTLSSVNDNRTHAAKMLGISIRTLRNKLNEYREEMGIPAP